MPVNPAETRLFNLLAERQQVNPSKPIEEQTLEECRVGVKRLEEFMGKPAPVQYEDIALPVRDGYQIPIRLYNVNLKHTTPILIFYPGCGYILDLFEMNAIAFAVFYMVTGIKHAFRNNDEIIGI